MTKYVLIVQDKDDEAPYIYPGASFNSPKEASDYAWILLKESYEGVPAMEDYDADIIDEMEDPEILIEEELAHYYGATWDFRYLVDEIDI